MISVLSMYVCARFLSRPRFIARSAHALRFVLQTRSKTLEIYFPIDRYITLVDSFCTECVYSGKLLSLTDGQKYGQTDTALLSSIGRGATFAPV